ncbi:LacI family DNA-binding transcriptional regulator [Planctomonas sp. JC2975]|uniref:LacI family DNA-binding transcriptional regulator n=1 Tax=Planctomonas sp. JC2975 TaxID=2729626 RepID=UPI001472D9F1|nr:LacI family DNA-binding transcriptional regulator [Planctomonas sp. JC2975]NNC13562.1 LacI family DNA-binding transcriptional regulator [Planctomonas sp. JC2975]
MATIYEVAARAGVSAATVSRVFNGMNVSAEKSRLVRKAADELDFTPNRTARTLRKRNSEVLALVIPDIENPFFTSLARGVEDVAHEAGYSVVLCNSDGDRDKEAKYLDIAISEDMGGVIIAAADEHSDIGSLLKRGRPVVAVDRSPHGADIDAVTVDNRAGGRAATQALFEQGYSRVACITGPADVETAIQRADGWRIALAEAGADFDPGDYLIHADFRVDGGRDAMRSLLDGKNPPDSVFVANNLMSVGALQVLIERRQMPPAVGMASFGDLPFAALAPAGITVVHLPSRHLGVTAATMLLERIKGDKQPARTVVLRNTLSAPGASASPDDASGGLTFAS